MSPTPPTVSVLLVDDESANLLALEAILAPLGRRLVRAHSGAEALRHVLREDFAVILLDVRMPDMSGFEAAALIRSRARSQATPIIFLTGVETSSEMMFEGYSAGAVDYLLKPIVPAVLRSKVEVFTDLASMRQQLQHELQERRKAMETLAELNEQLQRGNEALARSNAELDAFCATVSHDLRTPLGHVAGFVQLLQQSAAPKLDERERGYLALAEQATMRMSELIADFLRFARLGSAAIQPSEVDMNACVQRAIEQCAKPEDAMRVQWQVQALPPAEADEGLLLQVWVNLLSNAIKYSRDRHPPRIRISGEAEADEVVYRVEDNGVGFEPGKAAQLFSAFTRLHPQFDGIGIGLASVKRIVHRHGGRVWAEAEPGRGARFHFTLPRVAADEAAHAARRIA